MIKEKHGLRKKFSCVSNKLIFKLLSTNVLIIDESLHYELKSLKEILDLQQWFE